MHIPLQKTEIDRLLAALRACEDAEEGGDGSFTVDLYEPEPAVTVEVYPEKDGIAITAAAYLLYSAEQDGWYMGERECDKSKLLELSKRVLAMAL